MTRYVACFVGAASALGCATSPAGEGDGERETGDATGETGPSEQESGELRGLGCDIEVVVDTRDDEALEHMVFRSLAIAPDGDLVLGGAALDEASASSILLRLEGSQLQWLAEYGDPRDPDEAGIPELLVHDDGTIIGLDGDLHGPAAVIAYSPDGELEWAELVGDASWSALAASSTGIVAVAMVSSARDPGVYEHHYWRHGLDGSETWSAAGRPNAMYSDQAVATDGERLWVAGSMGGSIDCPALSELDDTLAPIWDVCVEEYGPITEELLPGRFRALVLRGDTLVAGGNLQVEVEDRFAVYSTWPAPYLVGRTRDGALEFQWHGTSIHAGIESLAALADGGYVAAMTAIDPAVTGDARPMLIRFGAAAEELGRCTIERDESDWSGSLVSMAVGPGDRTFAVIKAGLDERESFAVVEVVGWD